MPRSKAQRSVRGPSRRTRGQRASATRPGGPYKALNPSVGASNPDSSTATNGTKLEHELIEVLRASDLLKEALDRLPELKLPDCYLVPGASRKQSGTSNKANLSAPVSPTTISSISIRMISLTMRSGRRATTFVRFWPPRRQAGREEPSARPPRLGPSPVALTSSFGPPRYRPLPAERVGPRTVLGDDGRLDASYHPCAKRKHARADIHPPPRRVESRRSASLRSRIALIRSLMSSCISVADRKSVV